MIKPDFTVYTNPHTNSPDDIKLLDLALYKQLNHMSLTKADTTILKGIEGDHIRMFKENGDYVFILERIPQSLNDRDKSAWYKKRLYQAIWDGMFWKALSDCPFKEELPISEPFIAVYQPFRTRFYDMDNSGAGIKSIMDAMVHMGIIVNDDEKHFYDYVPRRPVKVTSKSQEYVEIRLIPTVYGAQVVYSVKLP